MIHRSWLTAAELEVLRNALDHHRSELEAWTRNRGTRATAQDAKWRLHVVEEMLAQLNAP